MPKKTISKEIPLSEITLRRYEKPENLSERELVRKLCLSLGLLQPGDSRDSIVDVLHVLLQHKKDKKHLGADEIEELVKKNRHNSNIPIMGVAPSNIRRHLKRLKDLFIVENIQNSYRITEFSHLEQTFEERIEKFLLPSITNRTKEYLRKVDEMF